MVLEARSEVQGKPVKAILREMEQRLKARDSRQLAEVSQAIEESHRRGA